MIWVVGRYCFEDFVVHAICTSYEKAKALQSELEEIDCIRYKTEGWPLNTL